MFKHNRSYQTTQQRSIAIKSLESTKQRLTCAQKYSQYASIPSAGRTISGIASSYRKITNCTKMESVYLNGKFIGRNFCIRF